LLETARQTSHFQANALKHQLNAPQKSAISLNTHVDRDRFLDGFAENSVQVDGKSSVLAELVVDRGTVSNQLHRIWNRSIRDFQRICVNAVCD
jgi:hypothetical protein